jgi:hypothetical protein
LYRQCLLAWDAMLNRTQALVLGFVLVVWVSLLWTLASPRVAFGYLAAWMLLSLVGLLTARRSPG